MSKRGRCFFDLKISESSFHCSWVGSIPVGFWAHAWRRNCLFSYAHRSTINSHSQLSRLRLSIRMSAPTLDDIRSERAHLDILLHALKVETDGLFVKVPAISGSRSTVLRVAGLTCIGRPRVHSIGPRGCGFPK